MTKTTPSDAPSVDQIVKSKELSKIDVAQIVAEEASLETTNSPEAAVAINEDSLMIAARSFLRQHGVRKSVAAVRDAVEGPHDSFTAKEAVSALSNLGFNPEVGVSDSVPGPLSTK